MVQNYLLFQRRNIFFGLFPYLDGNINKVNQMGKKFFRQVSIWFRGTTFFL